MKLKSRLQGFSRLDDEIDAENNVEVPRHPLMSYKEIFDQENNNNVPSDDSNFCSLRPSKCLHGIYDKSNINRNIRLLDQYYQLQMSSEVDFDERFFINYNGLQHTPIKLVSPISNFSNTPVAL
jgi:hypothetical protein